MSKRLTQACRQWLARRAGRGARPLLGVLSLLLILCLARSGPLGAFSAQGPSPAAPQTSPNRQPSAPLGQVVVFEDHFESASGWVTNPEGSDTAKAGFWERDIPQPVSDSYGSTQIPAYDGQYDLVTDSKAGADPDTNDVDGGITSICSPQITLPSGSWESINVSFRYYLAHRTDATAVDGLQVQVVGNTTDTLLAEPGSYAIDNAAWELFAGGITGFVGQKIHLCVFAADLALDSVIEAGFDAVLIVANESTPPVSTASSPDYDNGGTIPVGFTASDGASGVDETCLWFMYETAGWTSSGMCASGTSGTFYFNPTSGDGTYYFQTVAVDNAGNVESGPSGGGDDSTLRDTVLPSSSASSPTYDTGGTIPVGFTAADSTSGVDETCLRYQYGTTGWTSSGLCLGGTSGTFNFSPTDGDGTYYFQTVATDNAGNAEGTAPSPDDSTVYDTAAPSSSASSPAYGNASPIPVGFAAADGTSGVAYTCLWYRHQSGAWTNSDLCLGGTSGTFDFSPSSGDGTYDFQTVASDNAGNVEAAPSGGGDDSTVFDTVDPTATASSPPLSTGPSWLVSWTGTDPAPGSGVDGYDVQYRVDSGAWADWLLKTGLTSATFGPDSPVVVTPDHTYSFQVRAYDLAGNQGDYGQAASTFYGLQGVYLPAVMRAYAPLTNGSFEYGWTGWTHGGSLPQAIVTQYPHSGSFSARLGDSSGNCEGGVPTGSAWVEQVISVPSSGVTHLRIYYLIVSEDLFVGSLYDRFEIWLNGSRLFMDGDPNPQGCDPGPKVGDWLSYDVDLGSYLGQNITLRLVNVSADSWFRTWTYVDDIQLVP